MSARSEAWRLSRAARCLGAWLLRRAALATGLLLCACAAGPDFVRPPPPALARYDRDDVPAQVEPADRVDADWWRGFQSPALDRLVADALAASPGLAAAEAALRQSESDRRAGAGLFYPSVSAGYSAQRERTASQVLGVAGTGSVFNLYTLGATVAYSLDLFGVNRRTVEALAAGVDVARYQRDAARLALAGNVVDAAVAHAAYSEQVQVTRRLAALQQRQLELIDVQVAAGVLPRSAALAQRGLLDATLAALPPLQARAAASRHLLAALTGKAPSEAASSLPAWADWRLPGSLPLTLPSTLVRQRPDILAAEARWHAANAALGAAAANLFPRLSLGAGAGGASNHPGQLGASAGRYWSVGPQLDVPLFSGGADLARRDSAHAALDAARADYRQAVVNAFDQVADVLSAVQRNTEAAQARGDALKVSQRTLELAEASRAAGVLAEADFLAIAAQRETARLADIDAQAQRLQDAVALYLALGGGWSAEGAGVAP
jgi:NodT family efflux transporter outer membrane factor (OMF) lipoprotein